MYAYIYKTDIYKSNAFKTCKVSLKILLHMSNVHTRGLTKGTVME